MIRCLDQQPDDLDWLSAPVTEWENYPAYIDFKDYVMNLHVINDDAERLDLIYEMHYLYDI